MKVEQVENYLLTVYKSSVEFFRITRLANDEHETVLEEFGHGVQHSVEFSVNGRNNHLVLGIVRRKEFGHQHFADRAAVLLWQHSTFDKLPKHVRTMDVGSIASDYGELKSLGDCREFFILKEFVEGIPYHSDLDRIQNTGELTNLDEERCLALSDYLAEIHSTKRKDAPQLNVRRVRGLIGHGAGVFGLIDSYPSGLGYGNEKFFANFERTCLAWRWRLKHNTHRLSQVHGDFHPWNVLFRQNLDFTVLDRSGGEWGEPADDVGAMTMNYIFYSLQMFGEVSGVFRRLYMLFWKNYLDRTGDEEILSVIQPFYAWRSLVLSSPSWYRHVSLEVRTKILKFATRVLRSKKFDFEEIEHYMK